MPSSFPQKRPDLALKPFERAPSSESCLPGCRAAKARSARGLWRRRPRAPHGSGLSY